MVVVATEVVVEAAAGRVAGWAEGGATGRVAGLATGRTLGVPRAKPSKLATSIVVIGLGDRAHVGLADQRNQLLARPTVLHVGAAGLGGGGRELDAHAQAARDPAAERRARDHPARELHLVG